MERLLEMAEDAVLEQSLQAAKELVHQIMADELANFQWNKEEWIAMPSKADLQREEIARKYAEKVIRQTGFPANQITPELIATVAEAALRSGAVQREVPMVKVTIAKKRNDCFPWGGWQYEDSEREAQEKKKKEEQKKQQQNQQQQGQPSPNMKGNPNQQSKGQQNGQNQKGNQPQNKGQQDKNNQQDQNKDDGQQDDGQEKEKEGQGQNDQNQDGDNQGGDGSGQNDDGGEGMDGGDNQNSGTSESGTGNGRHQSSGQSNGETPDSISDLGQDSFGDETQGNAAGASSASDEDGIPVRATYLGVAIESYGDHRLETYDSLDDFINAADDAHEERSNWGRRSSRDVGKAQWAGTDTFEEAVELARLGWPKGVVLLDQIADHYHQLSKWTVDKTRHLDVAGTYPIVPIFLGGDPACMVNDGELNRGVKPMMHIVVNRGYSWLTTPERIFNFGAALMVCIDQIETIGPRVELTVATANMGDLFGQVQERPVWVTMTTIKRPQEHIEKNRLAYALAHPAYSRRLKYSLLEQVDSYEQPFHWGYGKPIGLPKDLIEPGAVYIPQLESWESQRMPQGMSIWDDITKAVDVMQKRLGIISMSDGTIEMQKVQEAA